MPRNLIISPHTDDAIFSLGSHIQDMRGQILIFSPFAGIPEDSAGKRKHTLLRKEHDRACDFLYMDHAPIEHQEGDWLDDACAGHNSDGLVDRLFYLMQSPEKVFIPMGIHHPDHFETTQLSIKALRQFKLDTRLKVPDIYFYEELPYRVLYPAKAAQRFNDIEQSLTELVSLVVKSNNEKKEQAIGFYDSQIQNPALLDQLKADEHIWRLAI